MRKNTYTIAGKFRLQKNRGSGERTLQSQSQTKVRAIIMANSSKLERIIKTSKHVASSGGGFTLGFVAGFIDKAALWFYLPTGFRRLVETLSKVEGGPNDGLTGYMRILQKAGILGPIQPFTESEYIIQSTLDKAIHLGNDFGSSLGAFSSFFLTLSALGSYPNTTLKALVATNTVSGAYEFIRHKIKKSGKVKSSNHEYWDEVYKWPVTARISVWDEKPNEYLVSKIPFFKENGVKRVVDAGCGDGRNLKALIEANFDEVFGVDFSEKALRTASNRSIRYRYDTTKYIWRRKSDSNIYFIKGKLEELRPSYFGGEVDLIVCDHTLVHIPEVEKVIDNFHRILKPGKYAFLEFTSEEESNYPSYQRGRWIGEKEMLMDGVYFRFFNEDDINKILKNKFEIISLEKKNFTQPDHGNAYVKHKRHNHCSYFVVARKS